MRQYLKMSGLVTGSTRTPIEITDMDSNIGPIPGWRYLLDPEQITGAGAVLNRVDGVAKMPWDTRGSVSPPYPDAPFAGIGAFGGGRPAIQLRDVNRRSVLPDLAFPQTEWSVFAYLKVTATSSSTHEIIAAAPSVTVAPGEYGPRLGFTPNGTSARIWARGSAGDVAGDRRLSYTPAATFVGREAALLFTFSTDSGLAIYENGALVANDAAAAQSLTQGFASGQWRMFRGINADLGLLGILSTDLSRAAMDGYRARLFAFLAAHYG